MYNIQDHGEGPSFHLQLLRWSVNTSDSHSTTNEINKKHPTKNSSSHLFIYFMCRQTDGRDRMSLRRRPPRHDRAEMLLWCLTLVVLASKTTLTFQLNIISSYMALDCQSLSVCLQQHQLETLWYWIKRPSRWRYSMAQLSVLSAIWTPADSRDFQWHGFSSPVSPQTMSHC